MSFAVICFKQPVEIVIERCQNRVVIFQNGVIIIHNAFTMPSKTHAFTCSLESQPHVAKIACTAYDAMWKLCSFHLLQCAYQFSGAMHSSVF